MKMTLLEWFYLLVLALVIVLSVMGIARSITAIIELEGWYVPVKSECPCYGTPNKTTNVLEVN